MAGDGADGNGEWSALDGLGVLIDRAQVFSDRGDPPRYRMLESIRRHALDRLDAAGDAAQAWARLEHWGAELVRSAEGDLMVGGDAQGVAMSRLDAESDNLRALLARAVTMPGRGG
jgi:non-specific serine/threonine protein kinase